MRATELYRHLLGLLEPWTVEHIAEDRKQASLDGYFTYLSEAQRAGMRR